MTELLEYNCVIERADEIGGTLLVEMTNEAGERFDYTAGQYLYLEVEPDEFRPFSIASCPSQAHLELHVRLMADNPTLNSVQQLMVLGNKIRVRLAEGRCTLARKTLNRPVVFIAGGTGYAPFHAMLQELVSEQLDNDVYVFWGAASFDELYLHDELQAWSNGKPNLHYQPVVQFAETEQDVFVGMVHEAALQQIDNLADFDIYLGGSAVMVGAVYKSLVSRGANPATIYSDMLDLGLCNIGD